MKKIERISYHVVPDIDNEKDWRVLKRGAKRASASFANKQKAITRAKQLAKKSVLGQVLVHDKQGKITEEFTYGDDPRNIPG